MAHPAHARAVAVVVPTVGPVPSPVPIPVTPPTPLPPPPVVLILDGDLHSRTSDAQAFERHGCTAILAATVAEAIDCLSRPWVAIDVVFMAIDLPDAPCETVLAVLKNTPRFSGIRSVAHWVGNDARIFDGDGYGLSSYVVRPCEWVTVFGECFPGVTDTIDRPSIPW